MSEKIKVLIVDDHSLIIEGIRTALRDQDDMELVGYALTGKASIEFLNQNQVDVLLLDINLPDISGLDLSLEILRLNSSVKILALSTSNQRSYVNTLLENGAKGYLVKNSDVEEIREAIRQVYKGNLFLSKEAAALLYIKQADQTNGLPLLTRREREVLKHIAEGLTASEIGDKLFVSGMTIETHRRNLLAKLKAKNIAALVKIAMDHNLL